MAGPTTATAPSRPVSAKDRVTLIIGEEPPHIHPLLTGGGISSSVQRDNIVDPLTWQSGDDQRIVPTGATTGWQQLAPNAWRFSLRRGVTFHNGEPWNAQAALPELDFQGIAGNNNYSANYTGGFKGELVDDYTVDIKCANACPIFPYTSFFLAFQPPKFVASRTDEQLSREAVGFGPYKLVKWQPGVSVTEEAYDGYVPAGDHYEFQKPLIKNVTWQWRNETTVMAAMVKTGEADLAWDVGVDVGKSLPKDQVKSGSSAEVFALDVVTLWHPELRKKQVRQAMAHAINCQEMIEALYGGFTTCRGNIIWPGVLGATKENTAPYRYDPVLSRRLLQEAGYDPATRLSLLGRGNRIPKETEVYEAVKGYLGQVGIQVDVQIMEPKMFTDRRNCRIGKAVAEVLDQRGRAGVDTSQATREEYQAALDKGGASCPAGDLFFNAPSNETLDFGRQANNYLNCARPVSTNCDPSPGGFQDQLGPALAASGEERRRLLQVMADRVHDDVLWLAAFDLPVFYAANPKLHWTPRFDRRVRASTMWFGP
jgi:peptide/nickel transport system substrate-binding protein